MVVYDAADMAYSTAWQQHAALSKCGHLHQVCSLPACQACTGSQHTLPRRPAPQSPLAQQAPQHSSTAVQALLCPCTQVLHQHAPVEAFGKPTQHVRGRLAVPHQ